LTKKSSFIGSLIRLVVYAVKALFFGPRSIIIVSTHIFNSKARAEIS